MRTLVLITLLLATSLAFAQEQKPEPPEALVHRYRAAHANQNLFEAMRLVCLDGTPDHLKAVQEQSFREDFRHEIKRYKMNPVPKTFTSTYKVKDEMYETTLDVIAILEIQYEENPDIDSPFKSVTYPVGIKDGKWMIASARPVDQNSP